MITNEVLPLPGTISGMYILARVRTREELHAAQRLRFNVFNLELGEGLPGSVETRLDADEFDDVCEHLIVSERATGEIVGTYRMQTGESAARHVGYYSQREFNLGGFEPFRSEILELGRACVAKAHRNQTVLSLLWRGIAGYAREQGVRYLVGCSSLTSQDPSVGIAAFQQLKKRHLAPPEWRCGPAPGWECVGVTAANAPSIPRLMTAYLALGACICGEPAIDREFKTIDFLTWLDLHSLPIRVLRKFLG